MNLHELIIEELHRIAPEADPESLSPQMELREQLDMDSMDFLNLVTALCTRLDISIPERDYDKLQTLEQTEAYLAAKLPKKER